MNKSKFYLTTVTRVQTFKLPIVADGNLQIQDVYEKINSHNFDLESHIQNECFFDECDVTLESIEQVDFESVKGQFTENRGKNGTLVVCTDQNGKIGSDVLVDTYDFEKYSELVFSEHEIVNN